MSDEHHAGLPLAAIIPPPLEPVVLSDHIDCDALLATARRLGVTRRAIRNSLSSQESGMLCEALAHADEALFHVVNIASSHLQDERAAAALAMHHAVMVAHTDAVAAANRAHEGTA